MEPVAQEAQVAGVAPALDCRAAEVTDFEGWPGG
jgi:hypothetical protein